jgi:glycopeptide antibiotics resistance protein
MTRRSLLFGSRGSLLFGSRGSLLFGVLAVAYLGVIALLTLGPTLWRTRLAAADYDVLSVSTWLDPDTWVRLSSPEFVANILMFVPFGMLLRLANPRATWFGATVLGGAVSVTIEVLQVWTPRVSDPRDIVANALGTLAGALLAALLVAVLRVVLGAPPGPVPVRVTRPADQPGAG